MADKRLQTIFYGSKPLDLRYRWPDEYVCLNNRTLHLTARENEGTFEAGSFLRTLCNEFCRPARHAQEPCPAFVESHMIGSEDGGLATVKHRALPEMELCGGVSALLEMTQTQEERFFLLAYLNDKAGDESKWRESLVELWNVAWEHIKDGWAQNSRQARFDRMMWHTMRFPAMIPQVWLAWLHNAPDWLQKWLEENPSRVDFAAFWQGERHIIEIDGPSHYAEWDGQSHKVDEREYARHEKIRRSLERSGWKLLRFGRFEVKEAAKAVSANDWEAFTAPHELLRWLPFYKNEGYPEQQLPEFLPELEPFALTADAEIPF